MAGNAWDGYLWVDGWPVTPPRMQQPPREPDHPLQPQPQPVPQPVPAPPTPMEPPTHHQPAQSTHNSESQVNLAQVESRTEEDQVSTYTGTSYDPSQLSDSEEEDAVDDTIIKLGNGYAQCRAAREAAMAAEVTEISCNSNALSTEKRRGLGLGQWTKILELRCWTALRGRELNKTATWLISFFPAHLIHQLSRASHVTASTTFGEGGTALSVLFSLTKTLSQRCQGVRVNLALRF